MGPLQDQTVAMETDIKQVQVVEIFSGWLRRGKIVVLPVDRAIVANFPPVCRQCKEMK